MRFELRMVKAMLLVVVALLGRPWTAAAQSGESTISFIQNAYEQVGIHPTCSQLSQENQALLAESPNWQSFGSLGIEGVPEAARFVSTLFETQSSYNSSSPTFVETSSYASRNAVSSGQSTAFVEDLYGAFLQRTPDSGGLTYWVNQVNSYSDPAAGRRNVLDAFQYCTEFRNLAESLTPVYYCCPPYTCPSGQTYSYSACACQ